MNARAILTVLSLAASFYPAAQAAPVRIGAAGGVSGTVLALAPETSESRRMSSGKLVYHMDKVTTDPAGRMQVLLLDETVFTIGPGTELTLDEFVYDPKTGDGKVSAKITKGVFRFVTGKIAKKKPEKMKVKLPVGTIGIRGTIVAGKTDGNSATVALLGPGPANNAGERTGAASVESGGVTVELVSAGFGTVIPGPGQPPSPPFKLSPEQLSQLDPTPKAEPGAEEGGPAGKSAGTPTEESGQKTAGATGDLAATKTTGDVASGFNDVADDAATDISEGSLSDITQWDQMRAISGGTAFYNSSGGTYSCSGGSLCSSGGSGTLAFHFDVNFGAKTLGCGSSSCHVAFETGTLNFLESQIPVVSFSALQGDATLVFGTDFTGSNADFNGTKFSFKNGGKDAHLDLQFTGTAVSEAQLTGSSGATATGNANATCVSNCPAF